MNCLRRLPRPAVLISALLFAANCCGQERVALLIGNSEYDDKPLPQVSGQLEVLSAALKRHGFTVTTKQNVGKSLREDIQQFATSCTNGGVSLFYFAGRGGEFSRKLSRSVQQPDGQTAKEYYYEPDAGLWPVETNSPHRVEDIARIFREHSHARTHIFIFDVHAPPDAKGLHPPVRHQFPSGVVCFSAAPGERAPEQSRLADGIAASLATAATWDDLFASSPRTVAKQSESAQQIWTHWTLNKCRFESVAAESANSRRSTTQLPPTRPQPGDEWVNGLGMVFCWCPPGTFQMGIDAAPTPQTRDAAPVDVSLTEGFWISKYETTIGDYRRSRGREPSGKFRINHANLPLTQTKGPGAISFGSKYIQTAEAKADRVPENWEYRLPTEAEWEYACRAGSSNRFCFGNDSAELHQFANFADASLHADDDSFYYSDTQSDDGVGLQLAPIGMFQPNGWGIHDMHGNASEFVRDAYLPELIGGTDPQPEGQKGTIVYRGGAWCSRPEYCQSGFRHSTTLSNNNGNTSFLGLRLVLARKRAGAKK